MWGLPIAFCLVLVSAVTVIDASICRTCPSNACSQNEAHDGFCSDESYVSETFKCSYETSTRTSRQTYYSCGWFYWQRCERTVYSYRSVTQYKTCYRRKLVCTRRCCSGYHLLNGRCEVFCGHPAYIANGMSSYSGTTEGKAANYACNRGYRLSGLSRRVCQSNGLWSGSQPSCEMINCSVEIAKPLNGQVHIESTRYQGIARYECNPGYKLVGRNVRKCQDNGHWSRTPPQCIDRNECKEQTHNCHPDSEYCLNREGGFVCKCKPGYILPDTGSCIDRNECVEQTHNCHPDSEYCLNREGGFDCKCKPGYVLSVGGSCIDLNDCETGQHSCNPNTSVCLNTHGSYVCHCISGFEDSVTIFNERVCKDIDECKTTQAENCEHRCGNTLGSYQCHCNEGYSLQGNKCKRDVTPCAEEQLPVPGHYSVTCRKIEDGLKCELKCHPMFKFNSSEDVFPQYCHDGVWDFQRDKIEIPDCQPIKKRVAVITGDVKSNETCLARQKFAKQREDTPIPAYIEAQCKQMGGRRKRSAAEVGTLVVTFTFSEEIPFDCDFECLDKITWDLRFQFYEAQWRVATGLVLTVTNLETSEQVNVTLSGELEADNDEPQITCTSGRVLSQDQDVCVPCAPGAFFNTSGPVATCDPCPLHHYQNDSEQTECKACPNGTFTIARGSSELGDCRAPCSPGTASENGLAPCEECKKGFYQPESGANFCHKCDLGQITHSTGSTREEDCGCPAGRYWNDCLEKCLCANGGTCELDGNCICLTGLSGPYCTKSDPYTYHVCQGYYLISFWRNVDNPPLRHIFALTGVNNGSVSVTVKFDNSTPQESDYHLSSDDRLNLQYSPMSTVVRISANRGISMFGDTEGEEGGDAFAALPISPLLEETEFEEYLVMSHANEIMQTNFKSVILVVASTDNTQVRITPTQNASAVAGKISLEKDKEAVIVRHMLDVLTVTSSNDLSGTVIRTNKPIAVYSGHECGNIPVFVSGCSHLIEQMPPVRLLGYCYSATSFMGRQDDSYVKFVVAKDGTYVEAYENDDVVATYGPLDQGTFHERYLGPGRVLVLKSNHPIMVAQFSTASQLDEVGAPFMIVLPSLSQLVSEVPFYSKNSSSMNYITITLPSQYYDEDALILDGDPIYSNATSTVQSPLCGNFTTISLQVDPGRHYLQHTTPGTGFLLSVYGFGPGTSYGYSPGLNHVLSCDDSSSNVDGAQE